MKITQIVILSAIVFLSIPVCAQRTIHVRLMDGDDQQIIREAVFKAGGKTFTPTADRNGSFKLSVPSVDTLVIESPFYPTKKVSIAENKTFFYVTLNEAVSAESEVNTVADEPASFPGGMEKFYEYASRNVVYTDEIKRAKVEGEVLVEFIIDTDGRVDRQSVQVVKGVHPACLPEAIRVIRESPPWIPAKSKGRSVRQKLTLPIVFQRPVKKRG